MFVIAEACNNCCKRIFCDCTECCAKNCSCLASYFEKPFSLCSLLVLLVLGVPCIVSFIHMIIEWSQVSQNCKNPINVHLLIFIICHLINVAFCFYLYYSFSKPSANSQGAMERAGNMMMYDWGTCFYIVVILFQIAWTIVGVVWIGGEGKACGTSAPNTIVWDILLLSGFLLFMVLGMVFGFAGLVYQSCTEGSMGCCGLFKIVFIVCTCGIGGLIVLLPSAGSGSGGNQSRNQNAGQKKPNVYLEEAPKPMEGTGYSGGAADYYRPNQNAQKQQPNAYSGTKTGVTGQQEEKGKFAEMTFQKKAKPGTRAADHQS